jgi:hypothetical protein
MSFGNANVLYLCLSLCLMSYVYGNGKRKTDRTGTDEPTDRTYLVNVFFRVVKLILMQRNQGAQERSLRFGAVGAPDKGSHFVPIPQGPVRTFRYTHQNIRIRI